ncbi:hypothetical protein RRG08_011819 [Elysia crispata]|uniref:Uncharacterized protein n=1 Tax=Elysia crispata TaxID=231223 RepID=A0AAE0ZKS0_9GAST|nr:hypothetical protein RRG08_011819 [Elysia crispata]
MTVTSCSQHVDLSHDSNTLPFEAVWRKPCTNSIRDYKVCLMAMDRGFLLEMVQSCRGSGARETRELSQFV